MPGTLFVVATPIGNLEDLTFRALRTSAGSRPDRRRGHAPDRQTAGALRDPQADGEPPRAQRGAGDAAAHRQASSRARTSRCVSDAGTPGIADPGARFVSACHAGAIRVLPIPGPSAVTAALSASGLPADQFVFAGFPPSSGKAREQWLEAMRTETRTSVFFEAPHRIRRTLADLTMILAERHIFVFREISKIYESLVCITKN